MPFSFAATRLGCLTASCLALNGAWAQTAPPVSPEALADPARISERVRREADRPYHWIRLQAQRQAAPAAAAGAQAAGVVAPRERTLRSRSDDAPSGSLALSSPAPASRGGNTGPGRPDSRRGAAAGSDVGSDLLRSLDEQPPAAGPSTATPVAGASGALSTSASTAWPEPLGSSSAAASPEASEAGAGSSASAEAPLTQPSPGEAGSTSPASGARAMPAPSLAPSRPTTLPATAAPAPGDTSQGGGSASSDPARSPAEPALVADSRLALLKQEPPAFPSYWTQRLRRGEVELKFEVAPDGQVRGASVVKSSHPQLRRAALDAVQQWRFAPISVAREAVVTVGFDLDQ